ncbi:hypothetical protein ARAM_000468 [Aspergillus rambellii]|uniref:Asparagine-linked glycosylation protein 2 n=1 Tax=Aspergillus rambellii TaxID=308745 RepID=A0A0F8VVN9_9EURO|nr:hypothetical protein ARAM_000468 [Aspergillus rambellii]
MPSPTAAPRRQPANITIIHPDLGIGGAERLIIDVALALQKNGHSVTIYTSHRDEAHCFEEARDGTLDVRVRGHTVFPAHVGGRLFVLMAILRQLHLGWELLGDLAGKTGGAKANGSEGEGEGEGEDGDRDEIFIVDQVPACVPFLKAFGPRMQQQQQQQKQKPGKGKQRILFYCHFPDQLLARRDEGGSLLMLAKSLYRFPFDWFEGWAMSAADKVVANSRFTRGVVREVFGSGELGDVSVVYPCVDVGAPLGSEKTRSSSSHKEGRLWAGKKIILSVNRFERKKDLALAIRAYYGLGKGKRKGTRLVIAGGYDNRVQENVQYHKELDELATGLGLQTATSKTVVSALSVPDSIDVLFLPSVPTAFRDTLLSQAKLLLYTPINEHFGIVPVEAMRAGIPVLASNTGGPLETIVEGETGWLRDAKVDADWTAVIRKVLYEMDQKELDRMSALAKKRVESEFSLTAMGEKLEHEISDMLGRERRQFNGCQQILVFLAVDIDIQLRAYDNDLAENPPKRKRLSHEPDFPNNNPALSPRNSLFLFSDDIDVGRSARKPVTSKRQGWELESDPIVFNSSAPERNLSPRRKHQQPVTAIAIDDVDDIDDLVGDAEEGRRSGRRSWRDETEDFSDPMNPNGLFAFPDEVVETQCTANGLSSRTANLLASLGERSKSDMASETHTKLKPRRHRTSEPVRDDDDPDEIPEPRKAPGARKKTTTITSKRGSVDKETKTREREEAKAQRDRERQLDKERKQKLKEEKAKEKQLAADIAEVNKLKVDKKGSTPEMIIDLASSFEETSVGNQTVEYMRRLGVDHSFFTSPLPNIVKWRRKMTAKYNDTLGYWEPCPPFIRKEEHVLCLLTAQEFVDMVIAPVDCSSDSPSELELHVLRVKSAYPDCTLIYLIEGLTLWMRKNTNSRNRAYQAEFRRQLDEVQATSSTSTSTSTATTTAASTSSRRKRTTANKPETTPPVDDDTIEDALLQLQVTHVCLIHHTSSPPDSAEWIKTFTEHISTVPYRRERINGNDSAFCMDGGQVKPGENKSDTFVKMLQEVNRVTASMAYGKSANRNGAITDSRIGPAASKRLYKVFMGLDPASTDV